jgi:hypothetical protein
MAQALVDAGLRPPSARVRTIAGLLGKDVAIARDLAETPPKVTIC